MSDNLHRLTPRPPLGWNSYDSFGCFINERRALDNLRVFADRLRPHGYEFFVIDAGWFRHYDLAGREFPHKDDPYTVLHDEYGRPVPARGFFPNGIAPLAAACHREGVKFGIHMMRGIPRAAVEANTPVLGTGVRARDIANPDDVCPWCPDNFGVDMSRPGAQAYYDSLIAMLAEWGVDFIKYDDIIPAPAEVEAVVSAIERCPRDIVLSLSPGNGHHPDGWPAYFKANMIRTTGDIWDDRADFRWVFERWEQYAPQAAQMPRGCWLDMDMIPFGELQVWNPPNSGFSGDILMNGKGEHRMSQLTPAQKRCFMAMRALAASPLIMGGNLPGTDEESFSLLTHPEVLACNQNGVVGQLVYKDDRCCVWRTPDAATPDAGWLGIFNRQPDVPLTNSFDPGALRLPNEVTIRPIWGHLPSSPGGRANVAIDPDDVLFARYFR